jgi:hypothetical protein
MLALYLVDATDTLVPFQGVADPPDPPPPPPHTVAISGVVRDQSKFGVTAGGRPYWNDAGAAPGEAATFNVRSGVRPYLETV